MNEMPQSGASRARETIRRACLLAGALLTAWCIVQPVGALFRVRDVDFARRQKEDAARVRQNLEKISRISGQPIDPDDPENNLAPTLTLEQYIAKQTAGRLIAVSGSAWEEFFAAAAQTLAGKSDKFAQHLNLDRFANHSCLYFNTDFAPLKELQGKINDNQALAYVALPGSDSRRYLEVLYQRPQAALHDAPARILYPRRSHAVWWFIAGLVAYALLPWHRKGPNELRYSTIHAMVGPDLLGVFLTVFFFTLPLLIITANSHGSEPLDIFGFTTGWWPLTAVMWLLSGIGLAMLAFALWYATFSFYILPEGFRRRTLFGDDAYAF
ncbi:MAG: hypothetical protein N3A66_10690, partial [Planctomycetota bacterium]|nr:hypothetical protein [Planctomycetota bacterium]